MAPLEQLQAPPARRQCGCSLVRLVQQALVMAVVVILLELHGPRTLRPSSLWSNYPVAFFGSPTHAESAPAPAPIHPAAEPAVGAGATCATVETMGEEAAGLGGSPEAASLRVRELIWRHFELQGAERVRTLPPHEFCKQGFVLGNATENGFGNEIYRILTAAALSIMLNRSLIIEPTRGVYPFGKYISYSNHSFTLQEIKHLWRRHSCARTYGRDLNMRVDNFEYPSETNVLCSDWSSWKDPITWFKGATDSVGAQFFLKNIHPAMKAAASALFGLPDSMHARPNTFGELMRAIISPSREVHEAVEWALKGANPDIAVHMRMMSNRPLQARQAAVSCIKRALQICNIQGTPRVALVSDTPSFVQEIKSEISEFAEVIYFDYGLFANSSGLVFGNDMPLDFRLKDWGPAPRWAAIVDFFLASRARHAVITGASLRVGTTYAQLIAALAASNTYGQEPSGANNFSIYKNLLVHGLSTQVGRSHVWDTYAGPLGCEHQPHQCALTPLLPPAWWDGQWQSPDPRDIKRLSEYGVQLSNTTGEVDERQLISYCRSRGSHLDRYSVLPSSSDTSNE